MEQSLELLGGDAVGKRMVILRHKSLTDHNLLPGDLVEQLVIFFKHLAARAEQLDAVCQRLGDVHVSAIDPELAVGTLVYFVVKNDEIANFLKLCLRLAIELINLTFSDSVMREVLDEASKARLNKVNTGAFEWFQEAAC